MERRPLLLGGALAAVAATVAFAACGGETAATKPAASAAAVSEPPPAAGPARDVPTGGPYPSLLMTQAQFVRGADGKPKPGPALLVVWRKTPEGWESLRVEDPDSNVFHKAVAHQGGVLTVGAEKAHLKRWEVRDGAWTAESLWNPDWDGKFDRIRDVEIGDVNGDGAPEVVMATHDAGVIGVGSMKDGKLDVVELDKAADTFVHEIEIGDVDGDGKNEFFATPSGRNQSSGVSQPGRVVMYKWDGTTYARSVVDDLGGSHAKEIMATDLDGDGKTELFSVIEAETELKDGGVKIVKPVEIRRYTPKKGGTFTHDVVATIDDRQTRFLVPGDFDGDGQKELVAAAMKSGIWVLKRGADGKWSSTNIERESSGFEHTAYGADLDGNGVPELYVAADDQRELRVYTYDAASGEYRREVIGPIAKDTITWNITATEL